MTGAGLGTNHKTWLGHLLPLPANLPIFQRRSLEAAGAGCYRQLREAVHFLRRVWSEVLRDAHVVIELSHGAAADGGAMDRQTEGVSQAFLGIQDAQQKGVTEDLHGLNPNAALDGQRQSDLLKTQVRRVGGMEWHQNGIPLVVCLKHRQMGIGIVVPGETEKAAFAGLFRGLEGLHRSSGREDLLHIGRVLNTVHLPQVHVIRSEALE